MALFAGKFEIMSTTSCSIIVILLKVFSQNIENSGKTNLLSSTLDTDEN
jgi:hypothetical protein